MKGLNPRLGFVVVLATKGSSSSVTFSYPTNRPSFNYLDSIAVTYAAQWTAKINMTVVCQETASSSDVQYYQTYDNPLAPNGTYFIREIGNPDDLTGILQFPTLCWFLVENIAQKQESASGGFFTMASTAGPAKTWGLAVPTSSGVTESTSRATTALTGTASAAVNPQKTAAGISSSSSKLSSAAKAGIGVGVSICILIMAAGTLYMLRLRRMLRKTGAELSRLSAIQQNRDDSDRVKLDWAKRELPA